jgi:hypothetical protein
LSEAAVLEPRHAQIQLHVGIVYAAVGAFDRAGTALNEASGLEPQINARPEVKDLRAPLAAAKQ